MLWRVSMHALEKFPINRAKPLSTPQKSKTVGMYERLILDTHFSRD
jgi:hypothetical protein